MYTFVYIYISIRSPKEREKSTIIQRLDSGAIKEKERDEENKIGPR